MSSVTHQMRQARQLDTLFELRLRRARHAMQLARQEYQTARQLVNDNRHTVKTLQNEMQTLMGLPDNAAASTVITQLHDRQLRTRWLRHDLYGAIEHLNASQDTLSEKRKTLTEKQRHWQQLTQRRECLDQTRQDAAMDSQIRSMAIDELQVAEQVCASSSPSTKV
ncbi:MAG: hypothetical protein AB8B97_11425 [Granulosicoccus sp.]